LGTEFYRSQNPMWVFDQTSLAFLEVNEAAVYRYGYSREEFLAMTILDIRPHEDVPDVLRHALRPHEVTDDREHWRHLTKNGEILFVEISGAPLLFENRPGQLITVFRVEDAATAR
jgi:two-component system, cell cycle sensor histidine kinase and response regulator CckA